MSAVTLKLVETDPRTKARSGERAESMSPRPPKKTRAASPEAKKRAAAPKKREAQALDLMTSPAISCSARASLNDAARLMWEMDLGALVVVDENDVPVGMLTDRDISMAAYTQGVPLYHAAIMSAMSRTLVLAQATTTVDELRQMMAGARVRRVPIVDESGRLCGIVGLADVLAESVRSVPKDRKRGTSAAMLVQLMDAMLTSEPSA